MPRGRKYPAELIERGVRLAIESGRPVRHVAADLGIHHETLRKACAPGRGRRRAAAGSARPARSARRSRRLRKENFELRRANEILKAASRVFRDRARPRPDEVTAFIDGHRESLRGRADLPDLGRVGVRLLPARHVASASARQRRGRAAARTRSARSHQANYEAYGYRRTWKALLRAGETAPRCRVQRLMRAHGIQGAKRRGKPWRTTIPDPDAHRRPDLVQRDFTATEPNRLWVGDLSYLRCWEGVVYFAFVIDVFSRRVVGWQLAGHMRTDLVLDALRMALGTREPGAEFRLVAHTDRGQPIHLGCLHPGPRRPPRARVGRLGRRRLRQRDGRELRRQLQDRADRRSRVAHPSPARARRRRVHQLV